MELNRKQARSRRGLIRHGCRCECPPTHTDREISLTRSLVLRDPRRVTRDTRKEIDGRNVKRNGRERERERDGGSGGFKVGTDVTYGERVVISEMATSDGVRWFLVREESVMNEWTFRVVCVTWTRRDGTKATRAKLRGHVQFLMGN